MVKSRIRMNEVLRQCYGRLEKEKDKVPLVGREKTLQKEESGNFGKQNSFDTPTKQANNIYSESEVEAIYDQENQVVSELTENRADSNQWTWVIHKRELFFTEEELDRGNWSAVKVAEFRGIKTAAKYPCPYVSSDCYQLFMKDLNLAARVRHPNLALFMGACIEDEIIIVMELMPTTLRKELDRTNKPLPTDMSVSIGLDIARALNYLHLMQPKPIIHQAITSDVILLESINTHSWRAKVTDYCSNNFQEKNTDTYAPPEGFTLSPKIDIFSFGILLIEMCTAKLPVISRSVCERLLTSIGEPNLLISVQRCIDEDADSRPSAAEIITILEEFKISRDMVSYNSKSTPPL